jgi:sugar phosphate isomerase/epimerase
MKHLLPLLALIVAATTIEAQKKVRNPDIGIVQSIQHDGLLHQLGYRALVESVGNLISPKTVSEQQFQTNLTKIKSLQTPLYAFNIFIPGELKVVGPEVNEAAVLEYVETVFSRAKKAEVKRIIWGSGGSRRVPDGFDPARATEQFVSIAKKIAQVASQYDITLALENLNSTETNFITTVDEALNIVKNVNHKNLRLCVDIYHMLKEGESPEVIKKTKDFVIYCEVAEKDGRTPPGTQGQDFRPYLTALKNIGYTGYVMIECRWKDVSTEARPAIEYLRNQIANAYNN